MSDAVVSFSNSGAIGTITLDRPPVNSYDGQFMKELDAAVDQANADSDTKVVLIESASEKFFSAGADIKAFLANDTKTNMQMIETAHRALEKMANSPKVYIAVINSHALGGGLEIALAADIRLAVYGDYRLGLPEVSLGLLPGNGGTQRLSRLIGPNQALEMMLTGATVSPEVAMSRGIVNQVFSRDSFQDGVRSYAKRLADGPTMAIANIKRAVYDGMSKPLSEALAFERTLVEPLFDSADGHEGLKAFSEKRSPKFEGK